MGNIFRVSSIGAQLRDTPNNPVPHNKKEMERAEKDSNSDFSDIYEVRRQCLNYNKESLISRTEGIAYIRNEIQNVVQNLKFSGVFVIKDMSFIEQMQARRLLES